MKVYISKKWISEWLLGALWVMPLFDTSSIRTTMTVQAFGLHLDASLILMMLAIVVLRFSIPTIKNRHKNSYMRPITLLLLYYAVRSFLITDTNQTFILWLWLAVPVIYAKTYLKCIRSSGCDVVTVARRGLILFCIAIMGVVLVNITVYGFRLTGDAEDRIISTGGGPVILGYTIVLIFALFLCVRSEKKNLTELFFLAVCTVGALLTGSRGGLWPLLILVLVYLFRNRKGRLNAKSMLMLFFPFALLSLLLFKQIQTFFPRFFSLEDTGRFSIAGKALYVYFKQPVLEILFGGGLGQVYPYVDWSHGVSLGHSFYGYNQFVYKGFLMIVQPHNTFIYTLLEGGIIGLALYIAFGIALIRKVWETGNYYKKLLCLMFMLLGFFESALYVAPGAMGLWWIILMIAMELPDEKHNYVRMWK